MSEETAVETEDNSQAVADAITRPDNVPEKFWNNETKAVNHDQVLESYNQLSSKFGAFTGTVPHMKWRAWLDSIWVHLPVQSRI